TQESTAEVARQIGVDDRPSRRRRARLWVAGLAAVTIAAGAVALFKDDAQDQVRFRTATVERGDLTVKVTATGQLQPVTQVEVGTEVSGTIDRVEVDFNDRVRTGQVLARLDPDQSQAKQRNSRAALALAVAGVAEAQATVTETTGKLRRVRDMVAKRMSSAEEQDTAAAAAERAVAALAVAKAKVEQAQAQLDADNRTLEKTEIRSPIDGTVLKRQVQPGQTVAASLQTPVLFTLAEDLTQMELNVAVDEADVGQVAAGQQAEFTVDAYPNRRFPATITQVRFAPETVGGVVTYAALLSLDNADLSLRPGMTATAEIVVKDLKDAVLVPNTALRFTPPRSGTTKGNDRGLVGMLLPSRPPAARRTPDADAKKPKGGQVWTLTDGNPAAMEVKTGITDGTLTEVLDGTLGPGTKVLVDVERTTGKP
ncbi:MAG TPA: efflux RND transporter periplasmic adaptor subunit, partial [Lamprocystis sp. (in: g-proteobacteria)]|nr:efflux RND transporter periplasmic adaptor subunit [Lamprocystis sp. (in: g-proteobacteria)]